MENSSDEEMYFMKKEQEIYNSKIKIIDQRTSFLEINKTSHEKCMDFLKRSKIFIIFMGYIDSDDVFDTYLESIINEDKFLENNIKYILKNKITDNFDTIKILKDSNTLKLL